MKNEKIPADAIGVDWRLGPESVGKVVFYQLADTDVAWEAFLKRLNGAQPKLLVLNREPRHSLPVPYLVPSDWFEFQKQVCDRFYPLPTVPMLAVTGTNGKTTTVDLILQLAGMGGKKGISIGTLGVRNCSGTLEEFGLTTPGYIQLRQILAHYKAADFFVMEASSHALEQKRLYGLTFTAAAWTNLSQDHLDFHGSMEEYAKAKQKLFSQVAEKGRLFVPATQSELLKKLSSFSALAPAPLVSQDDLPAIFHIQFNQENLACAWELVRTLTINEAHVDWKKLVTPPGRFHLREWKGRKAVVDFAHTPDALENICRALRESFPRDRLVVLFGCGGDRDRTKRPLMGKAAAKWAQRIILSSDNPRSEDPASIIADIQSGTVNHPDVRVVVDRPSAVRGALAELQSGEILLLAGKGHEAYIQVRDTKIPYSDIEELEMFLEQTRG